MSPNSGNTCEAAGIEGLMVHDLRHSFATLALQGGTSLYDIQKLLEKHHHIQYTILTIKKGHRDTGTLNLHQFGIYLT